MQNSTYRGYNLSYLFVRNLLGCHFSKSNYLRWFHNLPKTSRTSSPNNPEKLKFLVPFQDSYLKSSAKQKRYSMQKQQVWIGILCGKQICGTSSFPIKEKHYRSDLKVSFFGWGIIVCVSPISQLIVYITPVNGLINRFNCRFTRVSGELWAPAIGWRVNIATPVPWCQHKN